MSTRGAYLHVVGDTVSSIAVIIGAVAIHLTGAAWIDPFLALVVAAAIIVSAFRLLRECVDVLLQGVPLGIELDHVREAIGDLAGVLDVHDVHLWTITSGMHTFSCHIQVGEQLTQTERDQVLTEVSTLLRDRFGIHHSTVQIEGEAWEEVGFIH